MLESAERSLRIKDLTTAQFARLCSLLDELLETPELILRQRRALGEDEPPLIH